MPLLTKYKGQPLLVLNPKVKPPEVQFSFGISKAKVIIDSIMFLRQWYNNPDSNFLVDITPPINKTKKKFILNRDKVKMILDNIEEIQKFADTQELARENQSTSKMYGHKFSKPLKNKYEPDRFASE